jgi:pyroglutamyl-peptidase
MALQRVGLVTGSEPFAGLPTNPAELVLPCIDGTEIDGITIVARATPVSLARVPTLLPALVAQYQPAFVLAIGLAQGTACVRVEKAAVNAAAFAVADNEGARPLHGVKIDPKGPDARFASWDAEAVVASILAAGVPAQVSYSAGTHMCNLTLYTYLGSLAGHVPCGFLHLPYLPEQIVWLSARGSTQALDQPSMALATQVTAVRATLQALARQANAATLSSHVAEMK